MNEKKIILIYGLPGSGKTTLSKVLAQRWGKDCIWFNADKVRSTLSKDLGFSQEARLEQARRMGCLAALSLDGSTVKYALVDFVNPTVQTFSTFMKNTKRPQGNQLDDAHRVSDGFLVSVADYKVFSIYMDTIKKEGSRFEDTNAMFQGSDDIRKPDFVVDRYLETPEDFKSVADEILVQLLYGGA